MKIKSGLVLLIGFVLLNMTAFSQNKKFYIYLCFNGNRRLPQPEQNKRKLVHGGSAFM